MHVATTPNWFTIEQIAAHVECINDLQHITITSTQWMHWWPTRTTIVIAHNELINDLWAHDDYNCMMSVSKTNESCNTQWTHWQPTSTQWVCRLVKKRLGNIKSDQLVKRNQLQTHCIVQVYNVPPLPWRTFLNTKQIQNLGQTTTCTLQHAYEGNQESCE